MPHLGHGRGSVARTRIMSSLPATAEKVHDIKKNSGITFFCFFADDETQIGTHGSDFRRDSAGRRARGSGGARRARTVTTWASPCCRRCRRCSRSRHPSVDRAWRVRRRGTTTTPRPTRGRRREGTRPRKSRSCGGNDALPQSFCNWGSVILPSTICVFFGASNVMPAR